jgi:hypothetical protein
MASRRRNGPPFTLFVPGDPAGLGELSPCPNRLRNGNLPSIRSNGRPLVHLGSIRRRIASVTRKERRPVPGCSTAIFHCSRTSGSPSPTQFRAESFDLFQHPHFTIPGQTMDTTTLGDLQCKPGLTDELATRSEIVLLTGTDVTCSGMGGSEPGLSGGGWALLQAVGDWRQPFSERLPARQAVFVNVRESPHHTAGPVQSSVGTQIQRSAVAFIVWGSIYSSRNRLGIYCGWWQIGYGSRARTRRHQSNDLVGTRDSDHPDQTGTIRK